MSEVTLNSPPGTTPVVLMTFGSYLYGTNTATSDRDYKGVFLPAPRDVLLGTIPRNVTISTKAGNDVRNTEKDVEVEWFSLHEFVKLALEGQTVALDMLHAGIEHWHIGSPEWSVLRARRHAFYTKNLKAFIGYARRQAAKYGVKGSRLSSARVVLELLMTRAGSPQLSIETIVPRLQELNLEHVHIDDEYVEACGKKLQRRASCEMYIPAMQRFVSNYGERARQAESNEGIDWKAMSHAVRAAYEVQAILRDGDFKFPLPQTEELIAIKQGKSDYKTVAMLLEDLMEGCESLAAVSSLPEKPDHKAWQSWLVMRMAEYMRETMHRAERAGDLHVEGQPV